MYLRAKAAGAGMEDIANLRVLAIGRCSKKEKGRPCRHPMAWLYATRHGPLLVAYVPDPDHVLAAIATDRARKEFAGSRDKTLGARSEWDLVDAVLSEPYGWHPEVHTVVCWDHGPRPFSRGAFIAEGRRPHRGTVDIDV